MTMKVIDENMYRLVQAYIETLHYCHWACIFLISWFIEYLTKNY